MPENNHIPDQEEIEQRKKEIKNTLCCPHCGVRLSKWSVPQTPFTTWPNEFMYVCFNDDCSYTKRGWDSMIKLGNQGTYRLMYDPEQDCCQPLPVPSHRHLRDGIIEEE
ncbi:MAG: ogr/Delta-like zinc finger family protein [Chloroflexota bacterium]|nr:ogr/Delta-like zinc finger family protein [Chloroflexota bacterium]